MPEPGPTSRYAGLPTASFTAPDGRVLMYLRRRFVPSSEEMTVLARHRVRQGDRLDRIAAGELGDPEQFWRVCDANDALVPRALTAGIGSVLVIPLPQDG